MTKKIYLETLKKCPGSLQHLVFWNQTPIKKELAFLISNFNKEGTAFLHTIVQKRKQCVSSYESLIKKALRFLIAKPNKESPAFFDIKIQERKHYMMMMMNCFCGIVDRRKALSLISSRDQCQSSSPPRIFDTSGAGCEPAQNLSLGFVEWNCAVVITTKKK